MIYLTIAQVIEEEDLEPLETSLQNAVCGASCEVYEILPDGTTKVFISYEGRYNTERELLTIDSTPDWTIAQVIRTVQGEVSAILEDVAEPLEY
ncbi:hypothetical protein [Larkinella arboricola]